MAGKLQVDRQRAAHISQPIAGSSKSSAAWPLPPAFWGLCAGGAAGRVKPGLTTSGDPVGAGLAKSLSTPGGNVTGLSNISTHLVAKQLQLLKSTLPAASEIGVLVNTANSPLGLEERNEASAAARSLGLRLQFIEMHSAENFDGAFAEIRKAGVHGL